MDLAGQSPTGSQRKADLPPSCLLEGVGERLLKFRKVRGGSHQELGGLVGSEGDRQDQANNKKGQSTP